MKLPSSRYATVVIDPPWPSSGYPTSKRTGAGTDMKLPSSRYATVVIDPPWPSSGYPTKDRESPRPRGRVLHEPLDYATMSLPELARLDIPSLLQADAFVFLWTINRFIKPAFDLLDAWGLSYMCMMAWVKPHGPKPVGYPVYNMEQILVARQGSPTFLETTGFRTANMWEAPRNLEAAAGAWGRQIRNCTKPDGLYQLLRRVTPGPRLDMFSRRHIHGFDAWGDQQENWSGD